jgi:hypothetical protein
LWNPNGLFVQAKDNYCQDDSGRWPLGKLKPNVLLKPSKEKLGQNEYGQWFYGDKSRHILKRLLFFFQTSHWNPYSRLWPHNWAWSRLPEAPQSLKELSFPPFPFATYFFLLTWTSKRPKLVSFF